MRIGALPSSRVTAADVARKAGVSQPTVSLVLSGNPKARVADGTRQRIIQAARELGYRPNRLAQGLVTRRSYAIGLVVPGFANPAYVGVIQGAERVAAEAGYAVLLCDTAQLPIDRHLDALRDRQIDGVVIDAVDAAALTPEGLAGLNVVLVDQPSDRWSSVTSDADGAGALAARHLLELGHRDVAFIGPAADVHLFRRRERGFFRTLRESGVEARNEWLRRAPATVAGGLAAMRALLASRRRPTAVFCANDLVALGAHKACAAAGVRVPADCSILGCDDIELGTLVTPELSTIAIPQRELGARAVRLLLRQLEAGAPSAGPPVTQQLAVRLVPRGSTGPVPRAAA